MYEDTPERRPPYFPLSLREYAVPDVIAQIEVETQIGTKPDCHA
jgi:hypothetical protein